MAGRHAVLTDGVLMPAQAVAQYPTPLNMARARNNGTMHAVGLMRRAQLARDRAADELGAGGSGPGPHAGPAVASS